MNKDYCLSKKFYKILIILAIVIGIMLFASNNSYATNNPYIELKVADVQEVTEKDKQVTLELRAYNMDLKGFDIRLNYDETKVKPSIIGSNDYIETGNINFTQDIDFFVEEVAQLEVLAKEMEDSRMKIVLSTLPPITEETEHIKLDEGKTNAYHIEAGEEGMLLGKFSYRLFNGEIDENTFSVLQDDAGLIVETVSGILTNEDVAFKCVIEDEEKDNPTDEQEPKGAIAGSIQTDNYQGKHVGKLLVFNSVEINWSNIDNFRNNGTLIIENNAITEITTGENGTYSIELEPGEYDILIDKPGYLDYIVTNIGVTGSQTTNLESIKIRPGDIDKDGEINSLDIVSLTKHLVKEGLVDQELFKRIDFNEDGVIDATDLNSLKVNYGLEYTARIYESVYIDKVYNISKIDGELENGEEVLLKSYISNQVYGVDGANGKQLAVEVWAKDLSIGIMSMRLGFDSSAIVPSRANVATTNANYNAPVTVPAQFKNYSLIISDYVADDNYNTVIDYMYKASGCQLDLNNSNISIELSVDGGIEPNTEDYPNVDSDGNFITDTTIHPDGIHLMTIYFQIKDEAKLTTNSLYLAPKGQMLKTGITIWGMQGLNEYIINNPRVLKLEGLRAP